MRNSWRLLVVLAFLISLTQAEIEWHGYLMQHSAFRINKPQDAMLLRTRWRLNSEYSGENIYGFASFDVLNDLIRERSTRTDLKMAYIDIYSKYVDWRIGRQQVVWGKADGYFINDIVNPLDLSYFLLQDFEDIRISTTIVKSTLHSGNNSLEMVFIPEFRPMKLDFQGDWSFQRPNLIVYNLNQINPLLPSLNDSIVLKYHDDISGLFSFRKAEWGLKLNTFVLGTDLSLIYLKVREDKPVYKKVVTAVTPLTLPNGFTIQLPQEITLYPRHPWLQFYGLSFSKPIGLFVFRGEGGYFPKRYFDSSNMDALQSSYGIVNKPFWQGMIGVDYQLTSNIDLSLQGIWEKIADYEPGIQNKEKTNIGSILLRGRFFKETVNPMILTLYNFKDKSSISRILVDWSYSDNLTLSFGLDLLNGKKNSLFGQFDKNDNFYFKVTFNY